MTSIIFRGITYTYANYLGDDQKKYSEAQKYLLAAVDKGYERSVKSYASALFFGEESYDIKPDSIKAYVFATLTNYRELLGVIKLTSEQQQEANKLLS